MTKRTAVWGVLYVVIAGGLFDPSSRPRLGAARRVRPPRCRWSMPTALKPRSTHWPRRALTLSNKVPHKLQQVAAAAAEAQAAALQAQAYAQAQQATAIAQQQQAQIAAAQATADAAALQATAIMQ